MTTDAEKAFGDLDLYSLMENRLKESYVLPNHKGDTVYECALDEYQRVREEVCLAYGFDEDGYMKESGGETPFDEPHDDVMQEVYSRIVGLKMED